jgi:uncharacterized membrane protein YsdA (DUF1294 family)/cold shock CspA family protein
MQALMRYLGRITDWNDAKGFGFVTPNGGGDRAFVHIKAFERQGRRPVAGDLIAYAAQRDAQGRLNASAVTFAGARARPEPVSGSALPRVVVASVAFAVLLVAGLLEKLPLVVVYIYVAMSGIAFFAYAFDKSAARRGRWRTKESSLHALALFGGWPGALMAQGVFRHKSSKAEFLVMFWVTVIANCGLLAWLLRSGALRG